MLNARNGGLKVVKIKKIIRHTITMIYNALSQRRSISKLAVGNVIASDLTQLDF